jgi:hypothetical protein
VKTFGSIGLHKIISNQGTNGGQKDLKTLLFAILSDNIYLVEDARNDPCQPRAFLAIVI